MNTDQIPHIQDAYTALDNDQPIAGREFLLPIGTLRELIAENWLHSMDDDQFHIIVKPYGVVIAIIKDAK